MGFGPEDKSKFDRPRSSSPFCGEVFSFSFPDVDDTER